MKINLKRLESIIYMNQQMNFNGCLYEFFSIHFDFLVFEIEVLLRYEFVTLKCTIKFKFNILFGFFTKYMIKILTESGHLTI